ncbi:MAG: hypothetical protein K6T27_09625, partial [Thermoleophilum sp.]|nr:hypothetical protein [Thermoleophilum sp.]
MITSPHNPTLKLVRKLRQRRWRERLDMFVAEGEDLVEAGKQARWELVHELHAGRDVAPELLAAVSELASGTRVLAIFRRRWAAPDARPLRLFLDGVRDPGNVGSCLRSAYALGDAQVVLAPGSADPFAPKAVRASMGHVRDLPKSQLGVDIQRHFEPKYITIRGKGDVIKSLRDARKKAKKVFLAADPDREGEAIAWHLANLLDVNLEEACRVVFHE